MAIRLKCFALRPAYPFLFDPTWLEASPKPSRIHSSKIRDFKERERSVQRYPYLEKEREVSCVERHSKVFREGEGLGREYVRYSRRAVWSLRAP
jgi:hypothetical protein